MDTDYLRDVLTVTADIRGMIEQATNAHIAAHNLTEPDETGMWLELIRNAADQLYTSASQQLRDTERAELRALIAAPDA